MLWLIWQMWFFLAIAFLIGLGLGWRLWSASGVAGRALQDAREEIGRLQRENDSLTKAAARHQAALDVSTSKGIGRKAEESDASKKTAPSQKAEESAPSDDLTDIKGIGPKAAAALNAEGVTRYSQIAGWTESDITAWDEKLNGRGRIVRDDWVGQAKAKAS